MNELLKLYRDIADSRILQDVPSHLFFRELKIAELTLNLASALGFSATSLKRIRDLIPFVPLLFLPEMQLGRKLGSAVKERVFDMRLGKNIVKEKERKCWEEILNLCESIYSTKEELLLPYPSVQVLIEQNSVKLIIPEEEIAIPSLKPPLAERITVLSTGKYLERFTPDKRYLLLSHHDPHGFGMMISTYLTLKSLGVTDVSFLTGYQETGDYGKFWKRTFPRLVSEGKYAEIVLLDLTVYAPHPERTLNALSIAVRNGVGVTLIDHHQDTSICARALSQTGANVVLTDIPSCFLGGRITEKNLPYVLLGALGDKDVTIRHPLAWNKTLPDICIETTQVLEKLSDIMLTLSPPPKEFRKLNLFPAEELVSKAELGFLAFSKAIEEIVSWGIPVYKKDVCSFDPKVQIQDNVFYSAHLESYLIGKVLIVNQALRTTGRRWYDILENELFKNETALYAISGRYLTGLGFNFLCVKKWSVLIAPPPICFLTQRLRKGGKGVIGHHNAFWITVSEEHVISELKKFISNINRYFGLSSRGVVQTLVNLIRRLLNDKKARDADLDT